MAGKTCFCFFFLLAIDDFQQPELLETFGGDSERTHALPLTAPNNHQTISAARDHGGKKNKNTQPSELDLDMLLLPQLTSCRLLLIAGQIP